MKTLASSAVLAAACVVMLSGFTTPVAAQVDNTDLSISNLVSSTEETRNKRDGFAAACMASDALAPKTGNDLVDMRCSLVAFEVCMNKSTGIISQSQGAKQNCAIIKGAGGAGACKVACDAAKSLPVGGNGTVGRYTGLTRAAVACYDQRIVEASSRPTPSSRACGVNVAVTACLYNGSSSPVVNAAILREATSGCASYVAKYPADTCPACTGWQLNHTN